MLAIKNRSCQQADRRWQIAFENSAIGIMLANFTGRFFAANSAFLDMLGYTESELYQLTFIDVTYEEDRKLNLDLMAELVEGRRRHFEMEKRYYRKDGSLVWARTNYALVPENGDVAPSWFAVVENITERKRIEEGLRESEIRQQAFLENGPNLIFLKDREGRYLYVNRECKRALRLSDDKILGRRDNEIFSPEQAAAFQANDRQVLEAGIPMEFEEVAVQEDGPHTTIVQKFPLFNAEGKIYAIGGIVTDITERKRAEKELLSLRDELAAELTAMTRLHEFSTELLAINEFHLLLEKVLDATISLQNADFGSIQLYDPVTQALEIAGQRGFKQDFLEYFKSVRHTGSACGRAMQLRERVIVEDVETDPEYAPHRPIAASAGYRAVQSTPLFSRGGELLGMLSTHFRKSHRPSQRDLRFTDLYARYAAEILERKQLETARRQVEEALQITSAQLARVSRVSSMGELAASIAHEINQPLTAVINNSNACLRLLADRNLEPEVLSRALLQIVADSTRASDVIARIRAFIKKAPAERNDLDVNQLIQEVLALTSRELSEREVLLERELTDPLPPVMGDRVQLQQVLLNLFMNGAEAMSPVTNRPRILRVQSRVDEFGDVLIAVRDSGTGLGMDGDRVFGPFFTTKTNGIGMGLTISRSIIEAHGGRLWAEPNSPEGAAFFFTIPIAAGGSS